MNLACRLYFWTVRRIIYSSCHVFLSSKINDTSWRKMSTSTQDKTNTSLPLPQERNSYTSTPYLVLMASMARKKWPQGWLTHPILLVKVCYRLSHFEAEVSESHFFVLETRIRVSPIQSRTSRRD